MDFRALLKINICLAIVTFMPIVNAALPLPKETIALDSEAGKKLLLHANGDYLSFLEQAETQANQAYCAVASSVIVLNVLNVLAPIDPSYQPYAYFTQNVFFTPTVKSIITPEQVAKGEMTLGILTTVLNTFPVKAEAYYSSDSSLDQFRKLTLDALNHHQGVIINFDRGVLQQQGLGHFSPVIAYNQQADEFLVLDVARYKYKPFWVKADLLFQSMQGIDNDSHKSRGFILISPR